VALFFQFSDPVFIGRDDARQPVAPTTSLKLTGNFVFREKLLATTALRNVKVSPSLIKLVDPATGKAVKSVKAFSTEMHKARVKQENNSAFKSKSYTDVLLSNRVANLKLFDERLSERLFISPDAARRIYTSANAVRIKIKSNEKYSKFDSIVFGNNSNQRYHTFRHTDAMGLDRALLQSTIKNNLTTIGPTMSLNRLTIQTVTINGQLIQYNAFKLPNGTINVGRIHGVP